MPRPTTTDWPLSGSILVLTCLFIFLPLVLLEPADVFRLHPVGFDLFPTFVFAGSINRVAQLAHFIFGECWLAHKIFFNSSRAPSRLRRASFSATSMMRLA